ncbi:hypothetical protein GCM10023185_38070 [Hymenobacter saemangeumensis]|uniref:Fibronectin type-III domain-containing protein n=2 Tax=Hymenobacter saemangeumensis TaxID=1084522 RepID=A0ABP8IQW2_9BACT
MGLLGTQAAQAQLNYQVTNAVNTTTAYTDLGSTGTAITMANTDDANSSAQPIGFAFSYNGGSFTDFVMSTNGLIRLGTQAPSSAALYYQYAQTTGGGAVASTNAADVNLLMPFNVDLIAGTGTPDYRVATTGTAPNRVCTIQWKNVADKASLSGAGGTIVPTQYTNMSFQIKLYESGGIIEFVYDVATPGATSAFRIVDAGIKGSLTGTNAVVITKGSTQAWSAASFLAAYTGNRFNVRGLASTGGAYVGPDAGRTYRFVPTYANDAAVVAVYTLNKLPLPGGAPHIVRASIRNNGTATFAGQTATLTVTNTSTMAVVYTDTRNVINAASGANALVSFNAFTPPAAGTYSVTVTVPNDDNTANNSRSETQVVNTTGDFSYIAPGVAPVTARGFNPGASTFAFAVQYQSSTARTITGVRAQLVEFVAGANATTGKTVYAALFDATTGAMLARSADYVVTAADVAANGGNGTLKDFTLQTPYTLGAGPILVGLVPTYQAGQTTIYYPLGTQGETPSRSNAFFTVGVDPVAAPSDLSANTNVRLMIEAITTDPPACVPATSLLAGGITNTAASINFTTSATATNYTVTYTPQGGSATTMTPAPTASPINLTGLTPGTQYTVSITSNCAGGTTAAPATVTFTTLYSNDAATSAIYTLGQLPIPFGAPHVIQAVVTNVGQNTLTNLPVVLSISGANTFTNTQTVASLAPGASATVSFAGFTPTATGTNTISVSATDDNAANGSSTPQSVTSTTYSYITPGQGAVTSRGFGPSASTNAFAARFTTNASRNVVAVQAFIGTDNNAVGRTVFGILANPTTGAILAATPNFVITAASLGTLQTLTFTTPYTLPAGDFLAGLAQVTGSGTTQYFPMGVQSDTPGRTGTFYTLSVSNPGAPNDAGAGTNSRYMLGVVTDVPPACGPVSALAANSVTGTSANITFTAGGSNTSYTLTYTPVGGGTTQTVNAAASPIALSGLTPGTGYTVSVVGNCPGGATSTAVSGTLYTVPTNDQCSASSPLIACGGSVTGTTQGSTSTGDPTGTYFGNQIYANSGGVFYRFIGTGAVVTLSMCGSTPIYDSQLFVFTGSCGSLTNAVASSDDDCGAGGLSQVTFTSTSGTTYYVYVTGWNGARGAFTMTATCAPLTDLVVSTTQAIGGTYNNVTVTGTGVASLSSDLNVQGTLTVQPGGVLNTSTAFYIQGPGSLVLQAGATMRANDAAGITNDGTGPFLLTGTVSLSTDANYIFGGGVAQETGALMPAQARSVTVLNSAGLSLSDDLRISQLLRLQSGNLRTQGQAFTLLSSGSGTALVDNTGGTVVGAGTMQRAITGGAAIGYRHYSSPVQNTTFADMVAPGFTPVLNPAYNTDPDPGNVSPFPTVFGYNQDRIATVTSPYGSFDKGWFSPASLTTPMQPTRGYTANVPSSALIDFVGTFNNGTQNSGTLNRGTDADAGWHLLGNPYPAPLDWSTVTAAQRPGVDAAMYVYTATSQYRGFYRSYVNGVGGASPLVDAGQGYFVRVATAGTPGAVNLSNANRVTTFAAQPVFGRGTADTRAQLQLQVAGAGLSDNAYVYFEQGATSAVEGSFDAVKLANPSGLNLASLAGNTELAINGLPTLAGTRDVIVPLTLRTPQAGSFTLEAAALANFGTGTVYLRDAQTGTQLLLSQGTRYAFTLASTSTTRFSLVFRGASVTATQNAFDAEQVNVFPNPAQSRFTVLLPPVAGQKEVKATLLNALGQVVSTRTISLTAAGATAEVSVQGLAAGVYVLRLEAQNQIVSKRVVVNE